MRFHLLIQSALLLAATPVAIGADLTVLPSTFTLQGQGSSQRIVVMAEQEGRLVDVTADATLRSASPKLVRLAGHVAHAVGDGETTVEVAWQGRKAAVEVTVAGAAAPRPVSFELDVVPVLAAQGCSIGECHGKARGQNGFKLSLLGFDPDGDYAALVHEGRGRRLFPAAPKRSLLLRKGTALMPHGGGRRLEIDSAAYVTLLRWVSAGMPRRVPDEPKLERLELLPAAPEGLLMRPGQAQRLVAMAHYDDGTSRDVTALTRFRSNESAYAAVSEDGVVKAGRLAGETAIMARFMDRIAVCRVILPRAGTVPDGVYEALPRENFVDGLVWAKLKALGLTPSGLADDAVFMRRAYVDIIGTVPTAAEARAFLESKDPRRRAKLVDALLERPEYADHWANKWVDLLRPNPYRAGIKAVLNYDHWIRDSFRRNKPFDQFTRELLTAQGSTWRNGAVTLFRDRRSPDEIASLVSQVFLGMRLECAKCHQHPFEVYGQEDFYSFAAYFARIGHKGTGLSPPISGGEEMIYAKSSGEVSHPLKGAELAPRPLFGDAPEIPEGGDRRAAVAAWITSDSNHYFARTIVNRVWADMLGRGIVDPVDDLRATNPPSNEALMDALAEELRKQRYDLKGLIRAIANSAVYRLSSTATADNAGDLRGYSRFYRQRLRAEVLLDALHKVTGSSATYGAMPEGSRPQAIWTHRVGSVFLDTFGRPDPNQDPPCERMPDASVTQALHLMNAPAIDKWIRADGGTAARLAKSDLSAEALAEELYLTVYARFPTGDERNLAAKALGGSDRRQAVEDLMWALLNTPAFAFKH